jgi:hypothetical protein
VRVCKPQGQASFVSIQTCCVYPSTAVGAAKEQPADGAEDIDADESLDENPGLLVFRSMQESEACWHEPALYISDARGINELSGRELLKECADNADAVMKGFLANVRSLLPCSSRLQNSPDRTRSY